MKDEKDLNGMGDHEPVDVTWILTAGIIIFGFIFSIMSFVIITPSQGNWESGIEIIDCDIRIDPSNDTVEMTIMSKTVIWSENMVMLNDNEISTDSVYTTAGEIAIFSSAGIDLISGVSYNLKIIDISDNLVVYENDILGT